MISLSDAIASIVRSEKQRQYWQAFEQWKARERELGVEIDASQRLSREEIYNR